MFDGLIVSSRFEGVVGDSRWRPLEFGVAVRLRSSGSLTLAALFMTRVGNALVNGPMITSVNIFGRMPRAHLQLRSLEIRQISSRRRIRHLPA